MPVTLPEAVEYLLSSQVQSTARLRLLAEYCHDAFTREGLTVGRGRPTEIAIPGLARRKNWDLALVLAEKPRLLLSLKSILKNTSGSIPNRLDDLMGEAANAQQLSPELVIGYVVIMDEAENRLLRGSLTETWIDYFEARLATITIRKAPLWNQGLLEGSWLIRIDTRNPLGQRILDLDRTEATGARFFRELFDELYRREPGLRPARVFHVSETPT
jgi:hypothetical protein